MLTCMGNRARSRWALAAVTTALIACAEPPAVAASPDGRVQALEGSWLAATGIRIDAPDRLRSKYAPAFQRVTRLAQGGADEPPVKLRIELLRDSSDDAARPGWVGRAESFRLGVNADARRVQISSATPAGIVQGLNRLARELRAGDGKLRAGEVIDWPAHAIRGVHLTLRSVTEPMIKRALDEASLAGMNLLAVQMADVFRLDSPAVQPRRDALSKQQLSRILAYARGSGFKIVPEVKLLSHQEKFFKDRYPELMYNQRTYDPRIDKVYELAFEYLDEVIELFDPYAIHIGHDEIKGFTRRQRRKIFKPGEQALPPELFLQDVQRVYEYLEGRGVEVWMWGDMLVWPDEFPTMNPRHLHGNEAYAAIRPGIPRGIVIVDWHYIDEQPEYPTLTTFVEEGFRVVGAAWKREQTIRNFSAYAAANPDGVEGMLATTWFHLRRREWETMERIIRISGNAFWYAD